MTAAIAAASCKKGADAPKEPETAVPSVTASVTGATYKTVQVTVTLVSDGGSPLTGQGVCYGTSPDPDVSGSKVESPAVNDWVNIPDLPVGVRHYFRAYATNKTGTAYSQQVEFTPRFSPGEEFGGGYVFRVDETGAHGLVVSKDGLGRKAWSGTRDAFWHTGATSMRDGRANTDKIVALFGVNGNTAAGICRAYRGGGHSDWFLPAIEQLLELRAARNQLPGPVIGGDYWSSTEYAGSDSTYAWYAYFNKDEHSGTLKTWDVSIRAVREF